MGNINLTRVILEASSRASCSTSASNLLNELVLGEQWAAFNAENGMGEFSAGQAASFAIITLLFGVVLIWIYAAIRPRFGAGPRTAVVAGLTVGHRLAAGRRLFHRHRHFSDGNDGGFDRLGAD